RIGLATGPAHPDYLVPGSGNGYPQEDKPVNSMHLAHLGGGEKSRLKGTSGVSPIERPGEDLVEILQEGLQLALEVLDGGEVAPADHLAHDDTEDDLDLVEPRGVLGQVHEADSMTQVGQELLPALHGLQHP